MNCPAVLRSRRFSEIQRFTQIAVNHDFSADRPLKT